MAKNIGKYAGIGAGLGLLLFSVSFALAQTTTENLSPAARQTIMEQRKIKALQNLATTTLKQILENTAKRTGEATQNLEKVREEAKAKIQAVREKAQNKIKEIKDEQKKKQAEQIENQFSHLNQVWTDHFNQLLNKYETILEKIKSRADKAAANSTDMSEVDALITTAETAIKNARTAVETQAKKTYTVDITAINSGIATTTTAAGQTQLIKNLREQFKKVKNQLESDLKALRDDAIKDVRIATYDVYRALSKIPKVDEEIKI